MPRKKGALEAFSSRNFAADSSEVQDCFITKLKASRRAGARGKRESRGSRAGGVRSAIHPKAGREPKRVEPIARNTKDGDVAFL